LIVPVELGACLDSRVQSWICEATKFQIACNTIFLISKEEIDLGNDFISSGSGGPINVVSLTEKELIDAAFISNPWDILEGIIFNRCRTV